MRNKQDVLEEPKEVRGLVLLLSSGLLLLSLFSFVFGDKNQNTLGIVGFAIGYSSHALMGLLCYLLCPFVAWVGWRMLFNKCINQPRKKLAYIALFFLSLGILLCLAEETGYTNPFEKTALVSQIRQKMPFHFGGAPLFYLFADLPNFNLLQVLNTPGVLLVFSSTLLVSIFYLAKINPNHIRASLLEAVAALKEKMKKKKKIIEREEEEFLKVVKLPTPEAPPARQKLFAPKEKPITKRKKALEAQRVYNGDYKGFKMPPLSYLTPAKKVDNTRLKHTLKKQAEVLEETLLSFGIEAKVGLINCGPAITSFEVHPAIGVKVQKIKSLENDIALNLEAKSIRIIAPIPGKAAIGIEVPNPEPQEVSFKEMLKTYQSGRRHLHVPLLLGKSVSGDDVVSDLAKMPHCIIAGATGSGKSVCINTIIMSILMNARPDEIRMLMVDPKKVELSPYSKLPHMLAPVITEPQGALAALNWLVREMENRYDILRQMGVRNIEAFNNRAQNKEFEESLEREIPDRLPYIVGIIDELADLMMISSNDIETPIARIAQMARAVGIHLILATQRPSREVITGIIKANFPTRIAFKVASRINSQIILDETGADSLLGNGDMLFLPPGTSHLTRAQGAFIRDEDINRIVDYICEQAPPNYVIKSFDDLDDLEKDLLPKSFEEDEGDALYSQAKEIVTTSGNASTTFLQRKLKIGYARAASLMDLLEEKGVIESQEGSRQKRVKDLF
jgi:S-DNA-T family DNA segregation ATPase FtsK/SpoIIIE